MRKLPMIEIDFLGLFSDSCESLRVPSVCLTHNHNLTEEKVHCNNYFRERERGEMDDPMQKKGWKGENKRENGGFLENPKKRNGFGKPRRIRDDRGRAGAGEVRRRSKGRTAFGLL